MSASVTFTDDPNAVSSEPTKMGLSKAKSIIMTNDKKKMSLLLKLFVFIEAFTSKGLNHFCNIYLVVILGWSPLKASWVWFARDMVRILFQTVLGRIVDKTQNKRLLLVLIGIQKVFAGIIMVLTTNFAAHVVKGASDGFTMVAVLPAITAMTLGVVGKTRFHKKHAGLNSMIQYAGTFFQFTFVWPCGIRSLSHLEKYFLPKHRCGRVVFAMCGFHAQRRCNREQFNRERKKC